VALHLLSALVAADPSSTALADAFATELTCPVGLLEDVAESAPHICTATCQEVSGWCGGKSTCFLLGVIVGQRLCWGSGWPTVGAAAKLLPGCWHVVWAQEYEVLPNHACLAHDAKSWCAAELQSVRLLSDMNMLVVVSMVHFCMRCLQQG